MGKVLKKGSINTALPYIIIFAIWLLMPTVVKSRFWLNIFIIVFVKCIAAVGLRTVSLSGNMSFAQAAFLGVGAYTAAVLAKSLGLPVWATIPLGAVAATLIGVLTGLPFVRLRSLYYCMASMFLGVAIIYVLAALKITGGANGIKNIPALFSNVKASYYFFLALATVCCIAMYRFEFSKIGVLLRALSQSTDAAAAMGVNETFFRLLAIGVGCFFTGLAGAAYAHYNMSLSPTSFGMGAALWLIMYVMIGGKDDFIGPIIGSAILVIIPESSRVLSQYAPYISAVALLLVAYFLPGGLASIPRVLRKRVEKKRGEACERRA